MCTLYDKTEHIIYNYVLRLRQAGCHLVRRRHCCHCNTPNRSKVIESIIAFDIVLSWLQNEILHKRYQAAIRQLEDSFIEASTPQGSASNIYF